MHLLHVNELNLVWYQVELTCENRLHNTKQVHITEYCIQ